MLLDARAIGAMGISAAAAGHMLFQEAFGHGGSFFATSAVFVFTTT